MADNKGKSVKAVIPADSPGLFKGARQSPSTPSAFIQISNPKPTQPKK